jgi:hypothetical protein
MSQEFTLKRSLSYLSKLENSQTSRELRKIQQQKEKEAWEIEARESKKRAIQSTINMIINTIEERGEYNAYLYHYHDEDSLSAAYDYLKAQGFRTVWDRGEITISA